MKKLRLFAVLAISLERFAIKVAKVRNLYFRDAASPQAALSIRLEPQLTALPTGDGSISPSVGLGLKVSF